MPTSHYEIRKAVAADAPKLSELGRQTFFETFAKDNTPEDMSAYLEQNYAPEKQLSEISDTNRIIEIAWVGSEAVGFSHMFIGAPPDCLTKKKSIELSKLYILSSYIGKGLGRNLMQNCIEKAKALGFESMWLGVWEKNERALAFYKSFGFERVGEHIFVVGTDNQIDYLLEKLL